MAWSVRAWHGLTCHLAGKTEACGYDWSLLSRRINAESLALFGALPPSKYDQGQIYDYISRLGNGLNEANNLPLIGGKKVDRLLQSTSLVAT